MSTQWINLSSESLKNLFNDEEKEKIKKAKLKIETQFSKDTSMLDSIEDSEQSWGNSIAESGDDSPSDY